METTNDEQEWKVELELQAQQAENIRPGQSFWAMIREIWRKVKK